MPKKSWGEYPFESITTGFINGFGKISEDGEYPIDLQNVQINIYHDTNQCNSISGVRDWDAQICAGNFFFQIALN